MSAFENADATFDPVVPVPAAFEPRLFFALALLLRFVARFGQDNALDTELLSQVLVGGRVNAAIGTGLIGWPSEKLDVMRKSGLPLGVIAGIAVENAIVADDAAIEFIEPSLVAQIQRACPSCCAE